MQILLFFIMVLITFLFEVLLFFVSHKPLMHGMLILFSVFVLELKAVEMVCILVAACLACQLMYHSLLLPLWYFVPLLIGVRYGKRFINKALVPLVATTFSIIIFLYVLQLRGVGMEKPYTIGVICATVMTTGILSLTHNYYRVKRGNRS